MEILKLNNGFKLFLETGSFGFLFLIKFYRYNIARCSICYEVLKAIVKLENFNKIVSNKDDIEGNRKLYNKIKCFEGTGSYGFLFLFNKMVINQIGLITFSGLKCIEILVILKIRIEKGKSIKFFPFSL